MLPLPNPDAHELIGDKIGVEPRKVFFGINLVRQKMMLPKLPFPKRKLAVSPDQMMAVKSLYEPLLPLPPIGCHKIIAAQLRIEEWRSHVAIKLIRAQLGLDRWNEERPDKPADYMVQKYPKREKPKKEPETPESDVTVTVEESVETSTTVEEKTTVTIEGKVAEKVEKTIDEVTEVEEKPKKRAVKKAVKTTEEKAPKAPKAPKEPKAAAKKVAKKVKEPVEEASEVEVEEKPKRGRKPKKKEDE